MPGSALPTSRVVVVMGVAGSGKTTVGRRVAKQLGWDFQEGDSLHPAANVAKMAAGEPLTDADRLPWLEIVAGWIAGELDTGRNGVVTCSALKRSYRDLLRRPGVCFVYLKVSAADLERRMRHRTGHFMPASLLSSQLATLEPPDAGEHAITIEKAESPGRTAQLVTEALKAR